MLSRLFLLLQWCGQWQPVWMSAICKPLWLHINTTPAHSLSCLPAALSPQPPPHQATILPFFFPATFSNKLSISALYVVLWLTHWNSHQWPLYWNIGWSFSYFTYHTAFLLPSCGTKCGLEVFSRWFLPPPPRPWSTYTIRWNLNKNYILST